MAELIDRYTYRFFWSDEDEQYVALCAEFDLLSHVDDTPEKALTGIRDLVSHAVQLNLEEGIAVPEPLPTRRYSGTITLRTPPEIHRALAIDAAEAGVSMNRLATERLTLRRWPVTRVLCIEETAIMPGIKVQRRGGYVKGCVNAIRRRSSLPVRRRRLRPCI